ncbi:MAG: ABC transporter substrate-binding protein [Planctomycetota bacterium]|nr:ABC transporter substrate-binding protein [Planctomycetota bacterium]
MSAPNSRPIPSPPSDSSQITLRLGHSPDPDDAFMWFPLADFELNGKRYRPQIDTGRFRFVHVLEDIQSLNVRSARGELEITAISVHQYPFVAGRYALTSCGSSMGDNYGPMVVAPAAKRLTVDDLRRVKIAIPGERTTAFLAMSLLLGKGAFRYEAVPFDQIIERVTAGEFDAGLIIHEGQLTFEKAGLACVVDLGKWWTQKHDLPLPLGGNAIRRDLGPQAMREVCSILLASIRHALEHRDESVRFALNYARDMGSDLADRFVGMYVNKWTLDYGPRGRKAVNLLLGEGAKAGLTPDVGEVDFVEPELGSPR